MNIMIKLENIKRENDNIICQAFIEGCKEAVDLVYQISKKEFLSFVLPIEFGNSSIYGRMIKNYFDGIVDKKEKLPEKRNIVWY